MQAVTAFLAGARVASGLNEVEVAAALKPLLGRDISQSTIWRIERNKMIPGGDMLLGLAAVLKINPAELVYLFTSSVEPGEAAEMGARAVGGEVGEELIREAWRRVPSERRAAARQRIIDEMGG